MMYQTIDVEGHSPLPPPYSRYDETEQKTGDERTHAKLSHGCWDLACTIDESDGLLQLDATGRPRWVQDPSNTTLGDRFYRRDRFKITVYSSHVLITDLRYTWTCGVDTDADAYKLLVFRRESVSLRQLGDRVFVFERTEMAKDRDWRPKKPQVDSDASLEIKTQSSSSNVWTISGRDIYQVEGCDNDMVIRSPRFLRLWDMSTGRFRREKRAAGSECIWGINRKYVIVKVSNCHMYERKNGNFHGDFDLPDDSNIWDSNEQNHFGPVMSTRGLFLYKSSPTAILIFRIDDRKVEVRIWESSHVLKGPLVVRGNLEDLELGLIEQNPRWRKSGQTVIVCRDDFIQKMIT